MLNPTMDPGLGGSNGGNPDADVCDVNTMTQLMAEDYNPDLIDCLNAPDPAGCMACEQSLAAFTSTYGIELTEAEEDAILSAVAPCGEGFESS